jgi:hypothetical protein
LFAVPPSEEFFVAVTIAGTIEYPNIISGVLEESTSAVISDDISDTQFNRNSTKLLIASKTEPKTIWRLNSEKTFTKIDTLNRDGVDTKASYAYFTTDTKIILQTIDDISLKIIDFTGPGSVTSLTMKVQTATSTSIKKYVVPMLPF